jgi:hypothetical protein
MVKANLYGMMEEYTQEIFSMEKFMVKVKLNLKMETK